MNKEFVTELRATPILKDLNENEFSVVAEILRPVYAKNGDTIFHEGDEGKSMFILFSGSLKAYGKQSDGNDRWMFDIVKQGDIFGEMSIIEHKPRSATIIASEDSTVMILGEDDFYRIISEHPMIGYKILRAISVEQNQWLNQSAKSYSDLIRWGETARKRAITDEMTGLYNRRFLEDSIKERFGNQSMRFRTMSLIMMDLDKIHGINNSYGQKAGDIVITEAANVIRACLRPGDIPARLSGDEFAILLPDTDEEDALKVAGRIREKVESRQVEVAAAPGSQEKVLISTRTSIGIAMAPAHAKTTEELIDNSDLALRKAKDMGRNRVEIFE